MKRLKELREEKSLTQAQLAKELGLDYTTIGKYENGSREPSLEMVKKICRFFGVTTDFLLEMSDD